MAYIGDVSLDLYKIHENKPQPDTTAQGLPSESYFERARQGEIGGPARPRFSASELTSKLERTTTSAQNGGVIVWDNKAYDTPSTRTDADGGVIVWNEHATDYRLARARQNKDENDLPAYLRPAA